MWFECSIKLGHSVYARRQNIKWYAKAVAKRYHTLSLPLPIKRERNSASEQKSATKTESVRGFPDKNCKLPCVKHTNTLSHKHVSAELPVNNSSQKSTSKRAQRTEREYYMEQLCEWGETKALAQIPSNRHETHAHSHVIVHIRQTTMKMNEGISR